MLDTLTCFDFAPPSSSTPCTTRGILQQLPSRLMVQYLQYHRQCLLNTTPPPSDRSSITPGLASDVICPISSTTGSTTTNYASTSNPRPTSRPTTGMAHPHVPTTDTAHFYVFSTHSFPTHLSTPPSTSDEEDDDDAAQPPKHTLLHPIFSTRSLHQPVRVRRMTAFCVCQLLPLRTSTTLRIPTC